MSESCVMSSLKSRRIHRFFHWQWIDLTEVVCIKRNWKKESTVIPYCLDRLRCSWLTKKEIEYFELMRVITYNNLLPLHNGTLFFPGHIVKTNIKNRLSMTIKRSLTINHTIKFWKEQYNNYTKILYFQWSLLKCQ